MIKSGDRFLAAGSSLARFPVLQALALASVVALAPPGVYSADEKPNGTESEPAAPQLEEIRLRMDKWIETQQIISRERKDWQQGKDILAGRLELVKQEIEALETKTEQAQTGVGETDKARNELLAEDDELKLAADQLSGVVNGMETQIRDLFKQLPEPIQTKIQPLYQRIPEDPANSRVSVAERFQNVLGILNELNKVGNEITVSYEVHSLADRKPSEVQAFYIGLAQAYYVSARGEAGIGRPSADGWVWEPSKTTARDILIALEILQGKHTPAFVPLPVNIQ